jgi:hypothetical protein
VPRGLLWMGALPSAGFLLLHASAERAFAGEPKDTVAAPAHLSHS